MSLAQPHQRKPYFVSGGVIELSAPTVVYLTLRCGEVDTCGVGSETCDSVYFDYSKELLSQELFELTRLTNQLVMCKITCQQVCSLSSEAQTLFLAVPLMLQIMAVHSFKSAMDFAADIYICTLPESIVVSLVLWPNFHTAISIHLAMVYYILYARLRYSARLLLILHGNLVFSFSCL